MENRKKKRNIIIWLFFIFIFIVLGEFFTLTFFFTLTPKNINQSDEPLNINQAAVDQLVQAAEPLIDCVSYFSTDTDTDGVVDNLEKKYGTNPENEDSDADGKSDADEIKQGENPNGDETHTIAEPSEPLTDWQLYENKAYQYAISLPASWISDESADQQQTNFYSNQQEKEQGGKPSMRVFVYDNEKDLPLEKLLISWYIEAEKITPLKIKDFPAQRLEQAEQKKLVIPAKNMVLVITYFEDEAIIDAIVSTLVFDEE